MKRVILLTVLVLLFVLPTVFSSSSIICQAEHAGINVISTSSEILGDFSIRAMNGTSGAVRIISVYSEGNLVINEFPKDIVEVNQEIIILVAYPKNVYSLNEKILVNYNDEQEAEKQATILCYGIANEAAPVPLDLMLSRLIFTLSPILFLLSATITVYAYKKEKKKTTYLGILLLVLSAILLLAYLVFLNIL